jgi:deoxyribodipyrimidine photo-lyase
VDELLQRRSILVKKGSLLKGSVIYWMSRDQRVEHNWALIYALQLAQAESTSVAVVFCLAPQFLNAGIRQYSFMLNGLRKFQKNLCERNIPFFLLEGNPADVIPHFCQIHAVAHIITDFDPLRIKRKWVGEVAEKVNASLTIVDAHNIVPALVVSDKAEYGAYTIRPKIKKWLPLFLNDYPEWEFKARQHFAFEDYDWNNLIGRYSLSNVSAMGLDMSGEDEAHAVLDNFIRNKLDSYAELRNNPVMDATSGLSAYLHFGQISAQEIVQKVLKAGCDKESTDAFLEELIVRRELSDNFCYYNLNYDSFSGFPAWAKSTLNDTRSDEREFIYSEDEFERACTHDNLWNAAQHELIKTGKIHGYMRMYWAKKVLEWTPSPEEALRIAILLNDKYALDGRDPNGYVGCAWAIGGVHDRAWNKHPVFGSIRYMNDSGCKRKFNVKEYINKFS